MSNPIFSSNNLPEFKVFLERNQNFNEEIFNKLNPATKLGLGQYWFFYRNNQLMLDDEIRNIIINLINNPEPVENKRKNLIKQIIENLLSLIESKDAINLEQFDIDQIGIAIEGLELIRKKYNINLSGSLTEITPMNVVIILSKTFQYLESFVNKPYDYLLTMDDSNNIDNAYNLIYHLKSKYNIND